MKYCRYLLFPFSFLYGFVIWLRNFCYDKNIFKSTSFEIPTIVVGNLSTGGTGKTPQIEYLIHLFSNKKIVVLSRGYKRKTKGFILANENSTVFYLGDEPFQFYKKHKNITVAVCENRVLGIENILEKQPQTEIILLDDAFQHRHLKPCFSILLTTYKKLYSNDFILPIGNLREFSFGSKRANSIVVTKCPKNISQNEKNKIKQNLKIKPHQNSFF